MNHIKNLRETQYGTEGEVFFSLFDKFIGLTIAEGATPQFAEQCAVLLNNLTDNNIGHRNSYAFQRLSVNVEPVFHLDRNSWNYAWKTK